MSFLPFKLICENSLFEQILPHVVRHLMLRNINIVRYWHFVVLVKKKDGPIELLSDFI